MPPFRVISRSTIYQGRVIQLIREVLQVGTRKLVRDTVRHPGAVVIVPMLDREHLVCVRQYRRAVGRTLLELPAGTLEKGESKRACAQRELEEETGWRARSMRRIGQFYAAPGCLSEQLTIYLAEGLSRGHAHPEPDEDLQPVRLTMKTALAKIANGDICDAKTIIGILFTHRLLT